VSDLTVRSGSTYSNSDGNLHDVVKVIAHNRYNWITYDYDVALLQVRISFNVLMYNKMICDNQLHLMLLLYKTQFF